jgi:hypothetical protein
MHDHVHHSHINPYKLFSKLPLAFSIYLLINNLTMHQKFNNMHFMCLNKLYDFMQVIYNKRKFPIKN